MKLSVIAKPRAKKEKVEKIDDTHFMVVVKEPPVGGRANEAIAKALAGYFGISRSRVRLLSGFSSKQKVFEIE
ncbi:MAG: hypothetical protein A2939_03190 [Parcubacteria group bacterium RIFCSPLOWO2_01_FULL_48_18]|nr:MAG: hypothetical protein A3J67_01920 [Parcubacteria group bacterium RIFCSPHIGHO2_02_FULL_48_10b]OHB23394.1 MAG: hypothetical protein A2939_03190 [Parcubacteria group bacterium RIFCSPLOWO2_01_FULL_48_18]